jgi:hypothetical protein
MTKKIEPKEYTRQWVANKKSQGWRQLNMVIPAELAEKILRMKAEFKLHNMRFYKHY